MHIATINFNLDIESKLSSDPKLDLTDPNHPLTHPNYGFEYPLSWMLRFDKTQSEIRCLRVTLGCVELVWSEKMKDNWTKNLWN